MNLVMQHTTYSARTKPFNDMTIPLFWSDLVSTVECWERIFYLEIKARSIKQLAINSPMTSGHVMGTPQWYPVADLRKKAQVANVEGPIFSGK